MTRVLFAGAGIGGLAAALSLQQRGFDVAVFERSAQVGEVGAGIQVSPNGARVLHALGLRDALEAVAFRPEAVEFRLHKSGFTVARTPLGAEIERRYGFPYYHIHRADLHNLLVQALRERAGDVIHLERDVAGYEQTSAGVDLVFADGSRESADIVVGSDGIHSRIRACMLGDEAPVFTGAVAWRGVIPAKRLEGAGIKPVVTSWMAPRSHAVVYYVRRGELVNFVGATESIAWKSESWTERGDKADLRRDFAGWHPTVQAIVEEIEEPYRWALFGRPPLSKWSDGRVTLIGDACHPMLPALAQGAVMAIEDGMVLARCIEARSGDIPAALKQYEALRFARATRVQGASRANASLMHLSSPLQRLGTYGKLALASRLVPSAMLARNDWLMSYDATAVPTAA